MTIIRIFSSSSSSSSGNQETPPHQQMSQHQPIQQRLYQQQNQQQPQQYLQQHLQQHPLQLQQRPQQLHQQHPQQYLQVPQQHLQQQVPQQHLQQQVSQQHLQQVSSQYQYYQHPLQRQASVQHLQPAHPNQVTPISPQQVHQYHYSQQAHHMHHSPSFDDAKMSTSTWFGNDNSTPPQPPPRRRSLSSASSLTRNSHVCNENKLPAMRKDSDPKRSNIKPLYPNGQHDKLKEIYELAFKSPGRVKERAQKLNKMVSESELKPPMPVNNINSPPTPVNKTVTRSKESSKEEDNDSASVQPFDPLKRKWMIITSNCDYNEMVSLLKTDPTLAGLKDFTSGYTALHWAAKFGKPEIIKLIAGTHGINVNKKSHGGYTPLHLAAMHDHEHIMELLKIYGADISIRDHSGKLAEQYLTSWSPLRSSNSNLSGAILRSKQSNGSLNGPQRKMFIANEDYNNNNASTPNLSTLTPTSSTSPSSSVSRASSLTRNRNRIRQAHRNLFGKIPPHYKSLKF